MGYCESDEVPVIVIQPTIWKKPSRGGHHQEKPVTIDEEIGNKKSAHIKVAGDIEDQGNTRAVDETEDSTTQDQSKSSQCIRCFGHGRTWTIVAVSLSWLGFVLSLLSRVSLEFLHLRIPIEVASVYRPVYSFGLTQFELCFNETTAHMSGCNIVALTSQDVHDPIFELSRICLYLSVIMGGFLAFFLTTAVIWETINLRPIVAGVLVTYFLQSFSMLVFDSKVCRGNNCSLGTGAIFCSLACVCWVTACVATAKMDAYKEAATRKRKRQAERRVKKILKEAQRRERQKQMDQELSVADNTVQCNSEDSSDIGDYGTMEAGDSGPGLWKQGRFEI